MQRHYIWLWTEHHWFSLVSFLFLSGQLRKYARPSTCSLLESVAQTEGWQQREERAGATLKKHTLATHKQSHTEWIWEETHRQKECIKVDIDPPNDTTGKKTGWKVEVRFSGQNSHRNWPSIYLLTIFSYSIRNTLKILPCLSLYCLKWLDLSNWVLQWILLSKWFGLLATYSQII